MYHKLTIVGYLGRDPEMRYTADGVSVTTLSVASSRKWSNSDGTKGEETIWFRVTVWRQQAETVAQYLRKGSLVLVEGRLNPDKNGGPRIWTGQDGRPRASFEITAETVRFLDRKSDGGEASTPGHDGNPLDGGEELPF